MVPPFSEDHAANVIHLIEKIRKIQVEAVVDAQFHVQSSVYQLHVTSKSLKKPAFDRTKYKCVMKNSFLFSLPASATVSV